MDAKQFDTILQKRFDSNAKVMIREFDRLREDIRKLDDRVTSGVDTIQKSVDAYAKRTDENMQEMLALAHKVDRLERWIMKIAEETGVKLVA